jgi:hypothetical protein
MQPDERRAIRRALYGAFPLARTIGNDFHEFEFGPNGLRPQPILALLRPTTSGNKAWSRIDSERENAIAYLRRQTQSRIMIERLAPWLIGVAFLSFWCFVLRRLAVQSGWRAIAERFRTWCHADGMVFRIQSAAIGQVNYASCLTIVLSPDGLGLAVWPMFRFSHPPLLIPWSEFHDICPVRSFVMKLDEVSVGEPPIAKVRFRPKILRAARELGYLQADADDLQRSGSK